MPARAGGPAMIHGLDAHPALTGRALQSARSSGPRMCLMDLNDGHKGWEAGTLCRSRDDIT